MLGSVRSAWKSGFTRGIPSNFLYFLFTMDAGTPPWTSSKRRKGRNSRVIRGRTIKRERERDSYLRLPCPHPRSKIDREGTDCFLSFLSSSRSVFVHESTRLHGYQWISVKLVEVYFVKLFHCRKM